MSSKQNREENVPFKHKLRENMFSQGRDLHLHKEVCEDLSCVRSQLRDYIQLSHIWTVHMVDFKLNTSELFENQSLH
jgi:anti-sigma regulatory factor (Ser/Thr protein kinase)